MSEGRAQGVDKAGEVRMIRLSLGRSGFTIRGVTMDDPVEPDRAASYLAAAGGGGEVQQRRQVEMEGQEEDAGDGHEHQLPDAHVPCICLC